MKHPLALIAAFFVVNLFGTEKNVASEIPSFANGACTSSESWNLSEFIEADFTESFKLGLKNKMSAVQSFAEAIAYRKIARGEEARTFAEYWMSRSLYRAGLIHIAQFGWTVIAGRDVNPHTEGIQRAALECLLEIRDRFPTMVLSPKVLERLAQYSAHPIRSRAAGVWAREMIAWGAKDSELKEAIDLITAGSEELQLVQGMRQLQKKDYAGSIQSFKSFFSVKSPAEHLKRYIEQAHMLASRAMYTSGLYEEAAIELKKISRSSNLLAQALTEQAWAHLRAEDYPDAVGAGISLQSGGMKRTFAPEGLMVMVMALNELCQYPEAIKGINLYKKQYEATFKWLNENRNKITNGYQLALDFINRKSSVPAPIAGEWIRSPAFISRVEELNLLLKEKNGAKALEKAGALEAQDQAQMILLHIQKIRPKVVNALSELKANEQIAENVRHELQTLREEINHYERLKKAAGPWKKILAHHHQRATGIQETLVRDMNRDIIASTRRMHTVLDEITDTIQLIEVEIYSGASQDIVWQNAHPDYQQKAKQISDQAQNRKPAGEWNWGKVEGGLSGQGEVWEDELGSFKADLFNNCSSKEKYLQLKAMNDYE